MRLAVLDFIQTLHINHAFGSSVSDNCTQNRTHCARLRLFDGHASCPHDLRVIRSGHNRITVAAMVSGEFVLDRNLLRPPMTRYRIVAAVNERNRLISVCRLNYVSVTILDAIIARKTLFYRLAVILTPNSSVFSSPNRTNQFKVNYYGH